MSIAILKHKTQNMNNRSRITSIPWLGVRLMVFTFALKYYTLVQDHEKMHRISIVIQNIRNEIEIVTGIMMLEWDRMDEEEKNA